MGTLFLATNQSLYSKLTWDAQRDFAPISMVIAFPSVLLVHPSVPVKSVKELVTFIRARPGKLNSETLQVPSRVSIPLPGWFLGFTRAEINDAALALAACGGGGSDALSEREYIRALEDVCSTADDDLKDIPEPEGYVALGDLQACLAAGSMSGE